MQQRRPMYIAMIPNLMKTDVHIVKVKDKTFITQEKVGFKEGCVAFKGRHQQKKKNFNNTPKNGNSQ